MAFERGYTRLYGALQVFVEKEENHWSFKLYDRELGKLIESAQALDEDAAKQSALRHAKNYLRERGLPAPNEEVEWACYR